MMRTWLGALIYFIQEHFMEIMGAMGIYILVSVWLYANHL